MTDQPQGSGAPRDENVSALFAGRRPCRQGVLDAAAIACLVSVLTGALAALLHARPAVAWIPPVLAGIACAVLATVPGWTWHAAPVPGIAMARRGHRWVLAAGFTVTAVPSQVHGNPHGFVRGLHGVLCRDTVVDVLVSPDAGTAGKAARGAPWLPVARPGLDGTPAPPPGRAFSIVLRARASPFRGLSRELDRFAGTIAAVHPLLARYHHHGFAALPPGAVAGLARAVALHGDPSTAHRPLAGALLAIAFTLLGWLVAGSLLAGTGWVAWIPVAATLVPATVEGAGWLLSARVASRAGSIEVPREPWTRRVSRAFPLRPSFDHAPLMRAMDHEGAGTAVAFHGWSFSPVDAGSFLHGAALVPRAAAAFAAMPPAQSAQRLASAGHGWFASFTAGASGEGATAILDACLAGTGPGVDLAARGRRRALFLGAELVPAFSVPKEIASPRVPLVTPVEVLAPASMTCDVVLGKIVNAEWLQASGDAGIAWNDLDGGMLVAGGTPAARSGILRVLLARWQDDGAPVPAVAIDDHGDLLVPGATRVAVGPGGQSFNPLLPAGAATPGAGIDRDGAARAASYLAKVLAVAFGWRPDVTGWFAAAARHHVDEAVAKGAVPTVAGLHADATFDPKGGIQRAVATALEASLLDITAMHDVPAFDGSGLGTSPVVYDLSALHGVEKDVAKLVLVGKVAGMVKATGKPVVVIVPELDKAVHDARHRLDSSALVELAYAACNTIEAAGGCPVVSLENPGKLPVSLLSRFHVVASLVLAWDDDVTTMSQVLGLEREELYGRGRHASYQQRYLREMGPDIAFVRRPGFPAPFLVQLRHAPASRPVTRVDAVPGSPAEPASILDRVLAPFGPARDAITGALQRMAGIKHHGIKRQGLVALWEPVLRGAVRATTPGLKDGDARARARAMAGQVVETLVHHGVLVVDGYNPSGLVDGETLKLSAFGERVIGDRRPPRDVPVVARPAAAAFPRISACIERGDWRALRDLLLVELRDMIARLPDPAAINEAVPALADDIRASILPGSDVESAATRLLRHYQVLAGAGRS